MKNNLLILLFAVVLLALQQTESLLLSGQVYAADLINHNGGDSEEDTAVSDKIGEYRKVVKDAFLKKDYALALETLQKEEKLYHAAGDIEAIFKISVMRTAILELQGNSKKSIEILAAMPMEIRADPFRCSIYYICLGNTALRAGLYKETVSVMSREIEKIKQEIALLEKDDKLNEKDKHNKSDGLHTGLSYCYYFRVFAKYILTDFDDDYLLDIQYSIDELKKVSAPLIDYVTLMEFNKFYDPFLELMEKNTDDDSKEVKGMFVIEPAKRQPKIIRPGKTADDEWEFEYSFDCFRYRIKYIK
ncbi:MAG: hypothetical protein LBU65_09875 [Planctomycetaceae bacterium]|jgi:tetratricopeptide (TPR) repeat protein|nr:hypothetical protein [Planctomycetaceae bacterium]